MSVTSLARRAAGKRGKAARSGTRVTTQEHSGPVTHPPSSAYGGVDRERKWLAASRPMSKKKGGGASRRGSHRMSDAGSCEVRWYWSHYTKLEPLGSNFYTDYGTLIHTCLAYFYAERMERKPEWYIESPDVEAAMQRDALGNPAWLRNASDTMDAYKRFEAGDPWEPVYNEEEFEATVGQLDPDGQNEPAETIVHQVPCSGKIRAPDGALTEDGDELMVPCPNVDEAGNHLPHNVEKRTELPELNDEVVTCRPDLIVRKNGHLWVIDHKTAGGARNGSGSLPVINEQYPDYQYYWQAMVNLHIVRKHEDVRGFLFNRIKRDVPYDFSRDLFSMPARQYAKVPKTIRDCIRKERALLRKAITSPRDLVAHPWQCKGAYTCSYAPLCHVNTLEERNIVANTMFAIKT